MDACVGEDKEKVELIVEGAMACGLLLYSFVLAALGLLLYQVGIRARLADKANEQIDSHVYLRDAHYYQFHAHFHTHSWHYHT